MIRFDRVSFSYGNKTVLHEASFQIENGEHVAIQGASGCGKTTLLRLILGLEKPESGTVTVTASRIAVLFQEDRLLPYLSVAKNCELFAANRTSVRPMLRSLALEAVSDALPSALSGGMARRAALARALCRGGELYLLDEPFNGLDGENAERCAEEILRATEGKTLLVITHHESEAELLRCQKKKLRIADPLISTL